MSNKRPHANTILEDAQELKAKRVVIDGEITKKVREFQDNARVLTIFTPDFGEVIQRIYSSKEKALEMREKLLHPYPNQYLGGIHRLSLEEAKAAVLNMTYKNRSVAINDENPLPYETAIVILRSDDDGHTEKYTFYPRDDPYACFAELGRIFKDHPEYSLILHESIVVLGHSKDMSEDIIKDAKEMVK